MHGLMNIFSVLPLTASLPISLLPFIPDHRPLSINQHLKTPQLLTLSEYMRNLYLLLPIQLSIGSTSRKPNTFNRDTMQLFCCPDTSDDPRNNTPTKQRIII